MGQKSDGKPEIPDRRQMRASCCAGGFGQAERPGLSGPRQGASALGTPGSPTQGRPLDGGEGFPRPSLPSAACRPGDPPPLAPYGQPCAGPPPALAGRQGFRRGAASRSSPATPPDCSVAHSSAFSVGQSASRACQLDESGRSAVGAASTRRAHSGRSSMFNLLRPRLQAGAQ